LNNSHLYTRKIVLINRRFQFKYSFYALGIVLLVCTLIGVVAFFAFREVYQEFLNLNFEQPQEMIETLEAQLLKSSLYLGGLLLILSASLFVLTVYLTFRVAGPMYKLRKVMQDVSTGQDLSTRIHFRNYDDFKEIAQDFNLMMENLEKKFNAK
jgi:methyl-accepting chemotaxis protein